MMQAPLGLLWAQSHESGLEKGKQKVLRCYAWDSTAFLPREAFKDSKSHRIVLLIKSSYSKPSQRLHSHKTVTTVRSPRAATTIPALKHKGLLFPSKWPFSKSLQNCRVCSYIQNFIEYLASKPEALGSVTRSSPPPHPQKRIQRF